MSSMPPPDRCRLCGSTVDDSDVSRHLRVAHQVVPGEATIADIPLRPASTLHGAPVERTPDEVVDV